ncbi:MAG: hypothetical protein MZU91_08730 [Desulfosudis oleivorans]|nr:hypothetical protein [Desulfosudis oleivorans]
MGKNLVIIGGGAGGASTAAEAKRNDPSLKVTILQEGQFVSYASCPTPYYIGDLIKDANKLVARTTERFGNTDGGEPGIGKSTLMLQMMHSLAEHGAFLRGCPLTSIVLSAV